ncbi:siderophore-interacting protein [Streptomyces californicus]|uniref:siderophore-interacting protein n=1 Tax=Streptomyces californicus TaxID=67351 RepID=UPI0036C5C35C
MTSTLPAAPAVSPLRPFDLTVLRTRRLGPSVLRITLGGPGAAGIRGGGRDQSVSVVLPPDAGHADMDPADRGPLRPGGGRAVTRSYTVRAQRLRPDGSTELDLDFVLHGGGPASLWARAAAPGDPLTVLGPASPDNPAVHFRPPAGTDWVLIRADESALPAAAAALEWLPAGLPARVWLEIPRTEDRQALNTAARARISWLVRSEGAACGVESVRAADLPSGTPYAWIAGEQAGVRALRHHLVQERGFDPARVTSAPYWRRGFSAQESQGASGGISGIPQGLPGSSLHQREEGRGAD